MKNMAQENINSRLPRNFLRLLVDAPLKGLSALYERDRFEIDSSSLNTANRAGRLRSWLGDDL